MSILLIRHGETALNVARTLQPLETPLSERGRAQARALAARLAGAGIVAILSSDQPRALQTAQAIAAATGLPVETSELLRERNFGDLRGLPYDTLGFDPLTREDAPANGESGAMFRDRVAAAFAHALARRRTLNGPLAVVTHGLVIGQLAARHLRLADMAALPPSWANTSLTVVGAEPPHSVELLNCCAHLDAGPRANAAALSGG